MSDTTSALTVRPFDAASLLFPPTPPQLAPSAAGEILFRYGKEGEEFGWSLPELRYAHPDLLHQQDWYDQHPWAAEKLPSGLYVLRLPVPGSNRKTFDEQQALLLPNEEPAHVVLAATALLSIRLSGGQDPLKGDWARTGRQTVCGRHVALDWRSGRLCVNDQWDDDDRTGCVWLAAARRLPDPCPSHSSVP
jgi:hypothetical protein